MLKPKNRGGRPGRRRKPNERVPLGLRVTSKLKAELDGAAKQSGRSQSQEAEFRLERSFANQDLLSDVLELAYGSQAAALLLLMGQALKETAPVLVVHLYEFPETRELWLDFPEVAHEAFNAVRTILDAFEYPPFSGHELPDFVHDFGERSAANILRKVFESAPSERETARIRKLLGDPMFERRRKGLVSGDNSKT